MCLSQFMTCDSKPHTLLFSPFFFESNHTLCFISSQCKDCNTYNTNYRPLMQVETILMLLNGYELAPPQSSRPQLTHLVNHTASDNTHSSVPLLIQRDNLQNSEHFTHQVQPIVVPRDFDRTAAVSQHREKRKRARSGSTSRPTTPSGGESPPGKVHACLDDLLQYSTTSGDSWIHLLFLARLLLAQDCAQEREVRVVREELWK